MRRKSFDVIVGVGGLLLTVVLVAAGALLFWAYSFTNSTVTNQLSAQRITFPAAGRLRPGQAGHRDHPGDDPLPGEVRRPADDHGRPGRGLRQPLHRCPPPRDRQGPDLLRAERGGHGPAQGQRRLHLGRGDQYRPCSWAPRCAACCSTPTAGGRWARSPSSPP